MVKTDSIVIFVATTTQTKGEYNNEGSTKYLKLLVLQVKIVLVLELPVSHCWGLVSAVLPAGFHHRKVQRWFQFPPVASQHEPC